MEKGKFFSNVGGLPPLIYDASSSSPPSTWYSSSLAMEVPVEELNFSSEQLPNCFLNLNWENSNNQNVQFESGLSSIVSSQAASNSGEISPQSQRLGFNGASYIGGNNSTTTSCYSTPLNSPPTLNLSMMDHQIRANLPISGNSISTHPSLTPFNSDPGFAERAAKFCFVNRSFGGLTGQIGLNEVEFPYKSMPRMENEKLSRVSSNQSLMAASGSQMGSEENKDSPPLKARFDTEMRSVSASASDKKFSRLSSSSTPDNAEFVNAPNESSLSEQIPGEDTGLKSSNAINGRKRKAAPKGKAKEYPSSPSAKDSKIAEEDEDSNSKRHKLDEPKIEPNGNSNSAKDQKQMKDISKPPEPPKDYIHVRARRGQATDSHSLAERVRREKISERMKLLQDLVPGCNKVTGKAVMLDEIINYVQSLQRQVEFLSMKLATVNPRLDFNMESLLSKDILQMRGGLSPHTIYPLNSSSSTFPYGRESHCSVNPLDHTLQNPNVQLPSVHGFAEAASQVTTFWDDDLPSFIQLGFGQNLSQEPFQPQNFHG